MKRVIELASLMVIMAIMLFQFHTFNKMFIPVSLKDDNIVELKLLKLGAPQNKVKSLADAITVASKQTDISSNLLIALIYTESSFNHNAKSSKNYNGYMQIPYILPWADANVLIGARILKEKLRITDGDLKKALCLYKGWKVTDSRGLFEANKVIKLYKSIEI